MSPEEKNEARKMLKQEVAMGRYKSPWGKTVFGKNKWEELDEQQKRKFLEIADGKLTDHA